MGEMRNPYKIFVGKSEGNRSLERSRRGRSADVKMELKRNRMGGCGLNSFGSG
jgi:hypothetical protein